VVSSPVVNGGFAISLTPRRVYTIVFVLAVIVTLLTLGCEAPARGAQEHTLPELAMTKGPAAAPVTIVEFSDYQ
jgi:hypothetical protein